MVQMKRTPKTGPAEHEQRPVDSHASYGKWQ